MKKNASATHPHLLSPGRIGVLELKNRVVLPAMDMNLCVDGEIEQGDIDHYVARAAGGTGLILPGASAIAFPACTTSLKEPEHSEDKFIPSLRAPPDAVPAAGSKRFVQHQHPVQ